MDASLIREDIISSIEALGRELRRMEVQQRCCDFNKKDPTFEARRKRIQERIEALEVELDCT